MHPIDAYQRAVAIAKQKVPEFKPNTKEHDEWLRAFDEAMAQQMLKTQKG